MKKPETNSSQFGKSTISEKGLQIEDPGDIEKRLRLFFEAGVTPEFAENPVEVKALKSKFKSFYLT